MSYSHPLHTRRTHVAHLLLPVAVTTTVVALALDALAVWGDGSPDATPGFTDFLVVAAFTLVAAVAVFGFVVPRSMRRSSAAAVALTLGILAVVSTPVFWLGIGVVLGVGAVLLGLENSNAEHGAAIARAGAALGAAGAVLHVVVYVMDWMSTNSVF
jgi:hypothetical protein